MEEAVLVSCVTSGIRKEVEAAVSITIRDSLSNKVRSGGMVTFSYRDPSISSFSPSEGLANGGTLISIRGTSLHTGRNITASVGGSSCTVMPFNETLVQCVTSGASENSSGAVILKFDGAVRQSIQQFTYRSNPTIAVVQGLKSIASGGINITIRGEGFGIVQTALLIATLTAEPPVSSTVHCIPKGDDELVCPSPSLSANQSSRRRRSREVGRKRRRRSDVEEASLTLSLDGFEIDLPDTLAIYPDPVYDPFVGLRPIAADTALKLTGSYLDSAVTKSDVQVKIGPEDCKVLSIEADQLYCEPPLTQPAAGNELGVLGNGTFQQYPAVTVLHGSNLRFHLGYVNYSTGNSFSIIMVIVVAVLVVVAVIFILIAVSIYGRRVHQDKLKSAEDALIRLEVRLKDKATEAFHDLQRDMSGLKEQLEGVGMPFVSGADYIRNMLFWGLKVQPMTKDPELPQEHVRQAMLAFSKRLGEKEFLMSYIRELDDAKSLQQKDRVNIASLLTVILTTEGKFHYLTNVMLRLMEEKIEESDENRLKQLFRRTESIVEKLISNWIALCMYKHLQKEVAYPLYVLYQAIKGQCEKGPIDAITGQAHYSLNFDYLLDEDITFHEVTVQVVDKDHKVTEQVKVLDVDTITQAKQKILDAIYCKRQRSQQLRSYEVDLVLLNGQYGQVVLRDQDEMTDVRGIWVRSNTVRTYKISNGSSVAIVKKEEVSSPHLPGPLDKTELAFTSSEMPVPSSGRANHGRTSWEYTRIDMDVEEGKQLWHLVKEDSSVSKKKPKDQKVEHKPKLIKEVYTSRLLVTKNAVQHFLDEFLNATFSLGPDHTSLLAHIKFLFDFFDKQAEKHGNPKDNIATTWKNNSLPLRYWVTSISHPSFIFDMQQSLTADYCMNVLTNMLDNACRKIVPKYNLDASLNRILYRPELPKYIKMVESYYNAIADLPEISPAHLEETSQQVSKEFSSYFSRLGMLHQLYQFTKEHTEMLEEISAIIEERDD
ncbi:plexin-A1-like [Diadema setosum]|uniref:plexin-A1-like n=1 Tax=Diadema setosum TaxID=31175 RepID=UPI003B3B7C9E